MTRLYRVGQFFRALLARVELDEVAILGAYLPRQAQTLFWQMPRRDQRHGLDVLYALRRNGHQDRALMQAALLHDVGKGDGVWLWHRVVVVLLQRWRPGWLHHLAQDRPRDWRHPFYVHLQHPVRGAALAEAAGCDPLAVALIRHHQGPVPKAWRGSRQGELLAALKAADGMN